MKPIDVLSRRLEVSMKRFFTLACLLLAAAFAAAGCAEVTRQPVPTLELLTLPPEASAPAEDPSANEPGEDPSGAPKPMKVDCAVPDGFLPSEEDSSDILSVYLSDVAVIRFGWEESDEETATPEGFREAILQRLPEEAEDEEAEEESFHLISCEEAAFESYPGFVIRWTTGANEDTAAHKAHFILTDNFIYRVEYAVSADSESQEEARMKAFFDSVKLTETDS